VTDEEVISLLKKLHRRMQMKSVRLLQIVRKKKNNPMMLHRAYAWEQACYMLEKEINALGGQVNVRYIRKELRG
jgi:hypothetical protein